MEDIDRERWRGKVDAELNNLGSSLLSAHAKCDKMDARQQLLELKVQTVATKIGLYASLGAFVGGGLMSLIVGFFLRGN